MQGKSFSKLATQKQR